MVVTKIEAGEYRVEKDNIQYLVSKDSYTGGWSIYSNGKCITYKDTKKECLDFIDTGYTVKILDSISKVPSVEIDTHFRVKGNHYNDRLWEVDDVIYSSKKGKWVIKASYYNDSIDSDRYSWDYDEFENECEVTSDGCGRDI